MTELSPARLWSMRAAFVLLALLILFFHLLPLSTLPRAWAGPDMILAFALAWSLRRPEYVPALSLALVFLLADFLLQRPPGLFAVLTLIGCENLKARGRNMRDANFLVEWFTVSIILLGIAAAFRLGLAITLVDVPGITLSITTVAASILVYPLVVAVTHFVMGVRMAAPGDWDALGARS